MSRPVGHSSEPIPRYALSVRVLIAPQEFKGSLTAAEAARAIADGVRRAAPNAEIDEAPMSDGGPGFVDAMLAARGGERIETPARDPLMRPVMAAWALLESGVAVIEMAAASGLILLTAAERDPLVATAYGTGELIRAALDRGCHEILLGIGGSATVDAGAGAMQALGARLFDASGADLPPGGAALARLARIDRANVDARLATTHVRIAADVTNTLCGPEGAAIMFGPQKGASPDDIVALEAALHRFADVARDQFGADLLSMRGGGAAGGIATGLSLIADATIGPGFALVAEATRLADRIAASDIVITGEGRLDAQTALGKTSSGVARMAGERGVRVGIIAGIIDDFDSATSPFDAVEQASPPGMKVYDAMRRARELVSEAAERITPRLTRRASG
jgi:glycerate kinase